MPKKHRPKRGVVRKTGTELYFAYVILGALCVVLAIFILFNDDETVRNAPPQSEVSGETQLEVQPPAGDSQSNPQEALNQPLQSGGSGQQALQGSLNSQSSSVGSDQLQPSAGKEEYEAYEIQ